MAAFPRNGIMYIQPVVAGVGALPRMSTRQRNRKIAEMMESALDELSLSGYRDLIIQLRDDQVGLIELWQAKLEGEAALKRLRDRRSDPLLEEAVTQRIASIDDERVKVGYGKLLTFAPTAEQRIAEELRRAPIEQLRLSWLLEPLHVSTLYEVAQASGLRPNTVRRGLHRAVSDLLTRRFSRGRMLAVMADAGPPGENDERKVLLSHDEIRRAFELADLEMQRVFGLAITTGIDEGPMLAGQCSDYDEEAGTLVVRDTKAPERNRLLYLRGEPVLENAEYWLRQLVAGRAPDDPLVPLTRGQIRGRWSGGSSRRPNREMRYWDGVRDKLGRPDVRWKDLRGVFATYYLMAGGSPRDLQHILGHSSMSMTMRYAKRLPPGNKDQLREMAKTVGRVIPKLLVEKRA